MIEHLLVADPNPGNELLLEVMNALYFEALVMSAGYANGYPKSDLEYHESKLGTTCLLARVLQEEIGLRFRTMHMPFCLPSVGCEQYWPNGRSSLQTWALN